MTPEDKRKLARTLYMEGYKTQQQIAEEVGVSERTIHTWIHKFTWDKLRLFALQAPITIADNFCSQIVEMQHSIAGRNIGHRFPTATEADIMRKLVNSLDKLKKYPSLSTNMQVLETFRNYMRPVDPRFTADLGKHIERFIEGKSVNSYAPYQVEYGVSATAPGSFYQEEEVPTPQRVMCSSAVCQSPGSCQEPYCHLHLYKEPCATVPPLERYKPDLDHFPDSRSIPSTIDTPGLTTKDLRAGISAYEIEILPHKADAQENAPSAELFTATNELFTPQLTPGLTTKDLRLTTNSRSFPAVSISESDEKNKIAAAISAFEIEILPHKSDAQENAPSAELFTATNELSTPQLTPGLTTKDLRLIPAAFPQFL